MTNQTATKHETVLHRQNEADPLLFTWTDEEELPGPSALLTRPEWEDLGQPDTITVAIWPGDKLNEQPPSRAVREPLENDHLTQH